MLASKELIRESIKHIPEMPGVYMMSDETQKIIYIGKAKNLKNRLSQYLLNLSEKNTLMIARTRYLNYNVTDSEVSALVLESQLIKKHQPQFNILLKDDKSFPYIMIKMNHKYPSVHKTYLSSVKNRFYDHDGTNCGKIFGPFASNANVNATLKEIQKIFKLRSCSDSYFASRTKPCLQYQIKQCSAPCVDIISHEMYMDSVQQVKDFFSSKNKELQDKLSIKMQQLSSELRFEDAAEIRDKIRALSYIQLKADLVTSGNKDVDIIAVSQIHNEFCVGVSMYRVNQFCGNKPYFFAPDYHQTKEDILELFLLQFYQNKIPARLILLSELLDNIDILSKAINKIHNTKTVIIVPKRSGQRMSMVQNVLSNANLSLQQYQRQNAKNTERLKELQSLFGLKTMPRRIEIYDNSHIQGSYAVGVMVVAGIHGFEKSQYRLFNIKTMGIPKGDDYFMMQEVFSRRFKRLNNGNKPDIIIIDGGANHLSVVNKVLQKFVHNVHSNTKIVTSCNSDNISGTVFENLGTGAADDISIDSQIASPTSMNRHSETDNTIPFGANSDTNTGIDDGISSSNIFLVAMSKSAKRDAGHEQFHTLNRDSFTLDNNLPIMKYLQILRDEAHSFAIRSHRKRRAKSVNKSILDDIEGIGAKRKKLLLNYFGSLEMLKDATIKDILMVDGINLKCAEKIFYAMRNL